MIRSNSFNGVRCDKSKVIILCTWVGVDDEEREEGGVCIMHFFSICIN